MLDIVVLAGLVGIVAGYGAGDDPRIARMRGAPMPGTLSSVGGAGEESPPVYRPGSQAYVVSQFVKPKPPHQYWEEETSLTLVPENKNCLLCESQDSGACRAMPSCVYCEPTVTALCERSTPCLRCTENKNCLLCESQDSGACRAMPSCVYCEPTVTALCERSTPCLRCTVIKNPFFKCIPGEKYMDECDSCRCTDGHSGWCTNQFCEFRSLHLYAIKLSDGEFY